MKVVLNADGPMFARLLAYDLNNNLDKVNRGTLTELDVTPYSSKFIEGLDRLVINFTVTDIRNVKEKVILSGYIK